MAVNDHARSLAAVSTPDRDEREIEAREGGRPVRAQPAGSGALDDADRRLAPGRAGAEGVGVVLEAEHSCMSLRGVQKTGATTVSSALHGLIRDDPRTRQEFLALTTGRTS
jgi:hypothetical protein